MSRISAKRKARSLVFAACMVIVLVVLWANRGSIIATVVAILNSLAETYDSLAGG